MNFIFPIFSEFDFIIQPLHSALYLEIVVNAVTICLLNEWPKARLYKVGLSQKMLFFFVHPDTANCQVGLRPHQNDHDEWRPTTTAAFAAPAAAVFPLSHPDQLLEKVKNL